VSRRQIESILDVGRWSGSGSNKQPWEVLVVRDADAKRKMGEWGANPAVTAAAVLLIVSTGDNAAFDEGRLARAAQPGRPAHGLGSTVATLKGDGITAAKELFGIPADRRAHTIVAIGHTDQQVRSARPRTPSLGSPWTSLPIGTTINKAVAAYAAVSSSREGACPLPPGYDEDS